MPLVALLMLVTLGQSTTAARTLLAPDGRPLLPPRPNLGPEPWPSNAPITEVGWPPLLIASLIAVALGFAIFALISSRSRTRRKNSRATTTPQELLSLSSRERSITTAQLIRDALESRFGATWAAKTTEEVAADQQLAHNIGEERLTLLVGALLTADQAKFNPSQPVTQPLETMTLVEILETIRNRR
jgi:hypothetical protein